MSRIVLSLAAVNCLAVITLGASRAGWPQAFWAGREAWIVVALSVTGLVPLLQALATERGERARRIELEKRQQIETFLVAALVHLVRTAEADWETTGVQVFRMRRKRWWRRPEHVRVAKVRMAATPASGVRWTEGKGVIGRCAQQRRRQFIDLEAHFGKLVNCNESRWMGLSEKARFGLTFAEFERLKGNYGTIAAMPITDGSDNYVGCVAMDTPAGKTVSKDDAMRSLASTAALVKAIL